MTDSFYVLSTKSNSYIGYYTSNVVSLVKNEWEGYDVEVELFYKHTNAREFVKELKEYYTSIGTIKNTTEKDSYGFWVKKLSRKDIDNILISLERKNDIRPKFICIF